MSHVRISRSSHRVLPVNFNNHPIHQMEHERESSVDSLASSTANSVHSTISVDGEHLFMHTSHSLQLLTGLNNLRQEGLLCDVTIGVDGQEFTCHKTVLAAFSPYFKVMFTGNLAESRQSKVSINGVDPATFRLLIDYAYTSEIQINNQNVQALLSTANLLEVLPVKEACCTFLERNTEETNCLGIHCFAEAHACSELQDKTKEYILDSFTTVVNHDEFLNITSSKLIEFISDDNLNVDNEEIVFEAVLKWLQHDLPEREKELSKIMGHVRLAQLSPYSLHDIVEKNKLVMSSPECRAYVEDAKTFQLLEDRRNELLSSRTRPRKSTGKLTVFGTTEKGFNLFQCSR